LTTKYNDNRERYYQTQRQSTPSVKANQRWTKPTPVKTIPHASQRQNKARNKDHNEPTKTPPKAKESRCRKQSNSSQLAKN
jgi:hypothetical protein